MPAINDYDYESLLSELDSIAQDVCRYEFGLPLYNAEQKSLLRDAVIRWLLQQTGTSTVDESCEDPDTLI